LCDVSRHDDTDQDLRPEHARSGGSRGRSQRRDGGFIFFEKSPRHVAIETAATLADRARARGLKTVAVTVDMDDDGLDAIVASMKPDWLQLHGGETPERAADVKARYGLPVMKAFAIRDASDLTRIKPYHGIADRFLFDAKPPKGSDLPGRQWRKL
jgi:phosphoribosylanthranilate isomerase